MVYRGKPSAACGECRKRRSKCDKAVPACGQCLKASRICPGYRNTMDLMFHDESKQVASRNKSQNVESAETQVVGRDSSERALVRAVAASPIKLTDFVLYQPLDDLGVNFFMSTYVGDDPTVSQFHYLPKFYAKNGYSNTGLQQSITAAGLAGYAKTVCRKDLHDAARKRYVTAIRGINAAISEPETAVQDATLMSIIMAAMFEVLIIPRLSDMQNCSKHLDGAIAVGLMSLKHKKQTGVTQKLLTTLVDIVIINSWISHIPLPPNFTELKRRLGNNLNPGSVHSNFLNLAMELVLFRESLQAKPRQCPMAIVRQALVIDDSLDAFEQTMPPHSRFQKFRIQARNVGHLAYDGYYHVYPQRFTAHLWNNVRSSRLRLHQVILRQCRILLSSSHMQQQSSLKAQRAESEAQIMNFAIEISATVPQLAGYLEQLSYHQPTEQIFTVRPSQTSAEVELKKPPQLVKSTGTMEYSAHFGDEPSPFRRGISPSRKPSVMSVFYSDCNDDEVHIDAPVQSSPFVSGSQSASIYHMLFQLYSLRSVSILPAPFTKWLEGRIRWMENISNPEDLARLQNMVAKRPGDGFPIGEEG